MSEVTENDARSRLFDQFLSCLDREETLVHNRLSWGLQWHIAAFAAMFALNQISGVNPAVHLFASIGIAFSGVGVGWFSFIGVGAAHDQIEHLKSELERRLGIFSSEDWTRSEFIRPYGHARFEHRRGRIVAMAFPIVFIVMWVGIFFFYFSQISQVMKLAN